LTYDFLISCTKIIFLSEFVKFPSFLFVPDYFTDHNLLLLFCEKTKQFPGRAEKVQNSLEFGKNNCRKLSGSIKKLIT